MSELQAWLDKLGALSADEIRKLMQEEGVKGILGASSRCPIATFLTSKVSGGRVSVGYYRVNHHKADARGEYAELVCTGQYSTPCSVREFAAEFDDVCYPELICEEDIQTLIGS